ncbi:MAG TPA: metal-dependent transcriptional regulator [Bacilli bacterium]|nr:metal-dependent transcriptional regulator [Bacilli bacterium]
MNRAEEDYIKAVYELTIEKEETLAKTNELALKFGFSDQSVNEMVKRLVKKGIFKFSPYKGVSLTSEGRKEAIRMVRSHRLWELFLDKALGFKWHEVHEDAENLEHVVSPQVIEAIDRYLGYPTHCQHGNPIPTRDGKVTLVSQRSIFDLNVGEHFELIRVKDNKELLTYLNKINLKLHDRFLVTSKDNFVGLIRIKDERGEIELTKTVAELLFVKAVTNQ